MAIYLFISALSAFLLAFLISLPVSGRLNSSSRRISLWLAAAASLLCMAAAGVIFVDNDAIRLKLYQVTPGLELAFSVDRLAAFFIALIGIVALCAIIYSMHYVEHNHYTTRKNLLVSFTSLFILAMVLVVAADNTFALLFTWELMSVSSLFLVLFEYEKKETQKSAIFYWAMTQLSTVFLFFGFLGLYNLTGSFDIRPLLGAASSWHTAIFASLFLGFGIKAGVMPFHKWLPYAHSASPSNISALMSGVMIKVAIYGIVRFTLHVLTPELSWGVVVLACGTVSALLGVIYALKEHDIKKLLAYHSIENIGIILIGIGLSIIFQSLGRPELAFLALAGGLFHTLNHAIFKSLLFLAAGSVAAATGTRDIEEMGGLIRTMPHTALLFLVGAVSISALPPFNGFVSELMIFMSFLQSFLIDNAFVKILLFIGLSLFALTSALAAACFVKAFGIIFLGAPRSAEAREAREAPRLMVLGPVPLALLCAVLGVFSLQIASWLGFDLPTPDLLMVGLLLGFFGGLVWLSLRLFANRASRVSETWGCGLISQSSRMEYTASGFSEPILSIFRVIYRTNRQAQREFSDSRNAIFKGGSAAIHTFKIFEERLYMPVANLMQRVSTVVSRSHDVDLDTYILYAFGAIIVLLLVVWQVL